MSEKGVAPVRTIMTWVFGSLGMVVIALLTVLLGLFGASQDRAHNCACLWSKLVIWLSGIEVVIQGLEHLDPNNPQVLVANHQGAFDIWALSNYLPIQFRWVVKKELFRIPTLGAAMRAAGDISIDRFNPRQALKDLKQGQNCLKQGRSLIVFPEGTRSLDGQVGEFKPGAFLLAVRSKTPIVPISIRGSYNIMPKNTFWLHSQIIYVTIHLPIATHSLNREEQKKLPENVHQIIANAVHIPSTPE